MLFIHSLSEWFSFTTKNVADCKKHNLRRSFLSKLFFVYEADKTFGVAFDGGKIVFFHAFKERRGHGESERAGFEPFFGVILGYARACKDLQPAERRAQIGNNTRRKNACGEQFYGFRPRADGG